MHLWITSTCAECRLGKCRSSLELQGRRAIAVAPSPLASRLYTLNETASYLTAVNTDLPLCVLVALLVGRHRVSGDQGFSSGQSWGRWASRRVTWGNQDNDPERPLCFARAAQFVQRSLQQSWSPILELQVDGVPMMSPPAVMAVRMMPPAIAVPMMAVPPMAVPSMTMPSMMTTPSVVTSVYFRHSTRSFDLTYCWGCLHRFHWNQQGS
jgi:hypothetical protein